MVKFDKNNSFTVSIEGESAVYVDTIKALIAYLGNTDDNYISNNERFCVANLLTSMLPNPEQIINSEDIELLRVAKQNRATVNSIIGEDKEVFHLIKNEDYGQS